MTGSAFRLGDIRGIYPDEINEPFVESFAHAFVGRFGLKGKVATGRDMRASSAGLQLALNETLASIGVDVVDIGLCPTELGYYASGEAGIDAAIVVTASHNPGIYNGLKCVLKNGQAITNEGGLGDIEKLMSGNYRHTASKGSVVVEDFHTRYLNFLSQNFSPALLRHGQVALNGLNGTAATMADEVAKAFNLPVTWFRKQPGPIPDQGADPVNPVLLREMNGFMQSDQFSMGVAWDGDCDRCVFFDDQGDLIPTYYLIGLLIEKFLVESPGSAIVFDTKLCWNTLDLIEQHGGRAVRAQTGHAFMKQKMQQSGAVYGGELSSHHYFGQFNGCDSGMFAWLTVMGMVAERQVPLHELIEMRRREIFCTPENSLALTDTDAAFEKLLNNFGKTALSVDHFDGLSFSMPGDWRFSVRRSKTEPVVRLNFEARKSPDTMMERGAGVFDVLEPFRAAGDDWLSGFYVA